MRDLSRTGGRRSQGIRDHSAGLVVLDRGVSIAKAGFYDARSETNHAPYRDLDEYPHSLLLGDCSRAIGLRPALSPWPSKPAPYNPVYISRGSDRPLVSIAISRGIIFWTDHQTSTLFSSFVDSLNDVNKLLLVFEDPIQLVVVTCPEITHLGLDQSLGVKHVERWVRYHVLIAEKEHQRHRIVQLERSSVTEKASAYLEPKFTSYICLKSGT